MNELKELAEKLRKDADRAEAFSILLDKYNAHEDEYNQIIAWFNHSKISVEEMKKMLDNPTE